VKVVRSKGEKRVYRFVFSYFVDLYWARVKYGHNSWQKA